MASGEQTREGLTTFSSGATSLRLTHWLTAAAVLAVTLVALYVRAMTARDLLPQIDEPATLLAIEMVASKGVPLLPSGVLYLQGALISYLAAPIAWVTDADGLLDTVRFINLLISLAVPLLTMAITHRLTHSRGASVVAGLLAALDPNLIVWGILIRPYGLLTVESLALVYVFVVLLQEGAQARIGPLRATTWLVLIAFLGTFTHIGIWLLFPPLALVALLVWQRGLFGPQRPVLVATLVSLLAPILFLILSNRVGIGSSTTPGAESSGFIGSHLFDLQRMLDEPISLSIWLRNFYESVFSNVFPFLIAILSGVIIGAHLRGRDQQGSPGETASGFYAVVAAYWIPVLVVCVAVTSDPMPRYLNHVLPLGYVIIGVAFWEVWQSVSAMPRFSRAALRLIAVAVVLVPSTINAVQTVDWRMDFHGGDPDYLVATRYVAEHRRSDEIVVTALPPAAYFSFTEEELASDVYFLAGPAGSNRSERYIKQLSDGSLGDYWLGTRAIGSTPTFCEVLTEHAGNASIIVDQGRITAPWAFGGEMGDVITDSSTVVFRGPNGIQVRSVLPLDEWGRRAADICDVS